jgi:hypothetical protein
MKYVVGTTPYEYFADGVLFPKQLYSAEEIARGKKSVLKIEEDKLTELLLKYPPIKNLFELDHLVLLDELPVERQTVDEKLTNTSEELELALLEKDEATKLADSLKAMADEAKAKADALQGNLEAQAVEIAALKSQLTGQTQGA